ncbi:PREDICTED: putative uncharacterized protein DDB_G0282133 isoform X2 [Bactrocera latifrons]|uniref:putative uncharacterized protein DDB_G0282133 isoform X2 n=1 Tax=Bactrocera latifrons TaxID=174628 RepID=UPI0008DDFB73|nr:PREDICTED: putative uncharacterized protein DDB_G0282133 isoform X2 [Bactrocera latifrons]
MKFSCATFFFALTIAAQLQCICTTVSDDLVQYKRTLDEANDALQNIEESPALTGNAELQRQRRKSIDDLLKNSEFDLNLNLEREALNSDKDLTHPLQGRDVKQDNKKNKDDMANKHNVNDQLNDLVRSNSNFQNVHRKLLNSFHNSQSNVKNFNLDEMLQRQRSSDGKASKDSKTSSSTSKEEKEKNTAKDKESNDYSNANKNNQNKNSNTNKDSYLSSNSWKSSLSDKDSFHTDMDFGKSGAMSAPYSQTYSKFDSDSFNTNTNTKSSHKSGISDGSSVLTKAYISCKPVSSNAGHGKSDNAYFEFTSNLQNPAPSKPSSPKSNLNTFLLLEANNYRNSLQSKNVDNLEELNEKKVDPEMRKMMEKVEFPHFKLDFDTQMEDFARSRTKPDVEDDDEPISYEKTIENIHFPSIVNDQFDLGRNDLSHEADYKLSKIEQEQSEPRKGHIRGTEGFSGLQSFSGKVNIPSKRSTGFNAMDEIKLKTSTRLMAKGLGPSLPSYALSETQHELQLDDAVKKLEKSYASENHIGITDYSNTRDTSRLSKDELDWQDRLRHMEEIEEHSYEKLLNEEPEAPTGDTEMKTKAEDIILSPTYTILRRRRTSALPDEEEESNLLDLLRTKRVTKNPSADRNEHSRALSKLTPNDILVERLSDLRPVRGNKALVDEVPAPVETAAEEPTQEDSAAEDVDVNSEQLNDMDEAQLVDDNQVLPGENVGNSHKKRCGEQEGNYKTTEDKQEDNYRTTEDKSTRDKDNDIEHKMTVFKFKRELNKDEDSNEPKRRVKRIGVVNEDGELTAVKEVDLGGLFDLMTLDNLMSKRDSHEKENVNAEQENGATSTDGADKLTAKDEPKQKVLRRRRREIDISREEVFNDDCSHVLNGAERKRRSLSGKDKRRIRREAAKTKENEEKKDKEKTNGNVETKNNKPIDDEKDSAKKLTRSEGKEERKPDHLVDKRHTQAADPFDDNNGDSRKMINSALIINDDESLMPADVYERRELPSRSETLNDAAVIAADRKAMNAVRATYARNAERAPNYIDTREDNYGDLMERLRRLSLRNRAHEPERESEFSNSVGEFGNQKFDNLKEVDQNVRHFDGMPADNLWYGSDPWGEEQDNNNQQDKTDETTNRNHPNHQNTALILQIEDGAIKSIERKEQPSKQNEAGVVSEQIGNSEEEEAGGGDDAAFAWFGKKETKDESSCKGGDNGLVLHLNDQMLNCTAFNTLESFLKSVQQHQNRVDGSRGGGSTSNGSDNTSTGGGNNSNGDGTTHNHNKEQGRHGGHSGGGEQKNGGYGGVDNRPFGNAGGSYDKSGHGGYGDRVNGNHGGAKNSGSNSGDGAGKGAVNFGVVGGGNGLGPAGSTCGTKGNDVGSSGQKAMKLNITINASVMGDQKAKNFFGNGTFKVQSEDRERRGVSFPQFGAFKRYTTKRKCAKPKASCDDSKVNGKGSMELVKSMFNMAKCNPQMKPLWAVLKRNQQCLKKIPPQENSFEKMQKDDVNHIEDMVQQAMEAISDIIDDQVEQRSCIPLPPELRIFYDEILEIYESNSAEGVREKRAYIDAPFNEFSKEVRLIDPNSVEERSRIVKKLLRQYDGLPIEDQQQMVGVRDDLLQNLNMLQHMQLEQMHKKREPTVQRSQLVQQPLREQHPEQQQQPQQEQQSLQDQQPLQDQKPLQDHDSQQEQQALQEQQPEQEQENQPEAMPLRKDDKDVTAEVESDMQARQRREVLKRLEAEKDIDEQVIKAFDLPYTPEYVRLMKASELMQEQDQREIERSRAN